MTRASGGNLARTPVWLKNTGFPGDVCVVFFNIPPGNKEAVAPNPLTKDKCVTCCDDEHVRTVSTSQLNAGFSKVCEIFKVLGIESL